MAAQPLSDQVCSETLDAVALHGGISAAARAMGVNRLTLDARFREAVRRSNGSVSRVASHPARVSLHIENGCAIIFSDAHYWPNEETTAHRALVRAVKEFMPRILIANGDIFDGASISRHPRIGWDSTPTVKEEIEAVKIRLGELEEAARGGAQLVWTLGNHDARYETALAANSPQYQGVGGFALKDNFPLWMPAWRCDINPGTESHTIVKHRWKGGVHATRNNTANAGVNFVTGHLHSQKVAPLTDARGTRYGVDSGCLADPNAGSFIGYTEDGIKDWRSGFAILTYRHGRLLFPELVSVVSEAAGLVEFRGKEYTV